MVTISQLFPKHKTGPKGEVGIEIELEFMEEQVWDINPKAWTFNVEHSVRNKGYEIVSKVPLTLEGLQPMVEDVCENINRRKPIEDCPRTSVHIHLNQTKNKVLHVLNSAVAYWLLETPLTRYCGREREGHHFCLRLRDAEALIPVLCESLNARTPLKALGDNVRYAGLNLNALNKFGSLEFRTMRGTTDPKLIVSWAKGLHHLCSVAKTFESPSHVFDYFLSCTKEDFVRKLLPSDLASIVLSTPGYRDMMDESASIVCALAYAEDWAAWEKKLAEKLEAKKTSKPEPSEFLGIASDYAIYDDIVNSMNAPTYATTAASEWSTS